MIVSIDKVRSHLNLDDFFHDDDEYIVSLIAAAESATAKRLNVKSLSDMINKRTGSIPDDVIHSVLLLIGNWYSNREATTGQNANELPFGYNFLADLNKNYRSPF